MDHLPNAEFAANNHVNITTGMTPFFADHGYHPRTGCEPPGTSDSTTPGKAELLGADKIIEKPASFRSNRG